LSESILTCWIITGGDTGTENQCIGIAEALGLHPVIKRVRLRAPWLQLSPWLSFGHQYALAKGSDLVNPPYPDIVIAGGRKSIGIAWHIKKSSGNKTLLVQVQNPILNINKFDLVIVPHHDSVRGDNVIVTSGSTHRITAQKLETEKKKFESGLSYLPHPRVAVLIGGTSNTHRMTPEATQRLIDQLLPLKAGLMITASRRTGEENARILHEKLKGDNIYFWDGKGDNPYFAFLGIADYIIVTEDSVSMASEAISTGKPVLIAKLEGGSARFNRFHENLRQQGYTRPFTGTLGAWSYAPPDDTMKVADAIRQKMKVKG
jgi:mitochondrial fission protein ELM1